MRCATQFLRGLVLGVILFIITISFPTASTIVSAQATTDSLVNVQDNFDAMLNWAKSLSTAYPNWLPALPACPCTTPGTAPWVGDSDPALGAYQPGAETSFVSPANGPVPGLIPQQQCTYRGGSLITAGAGAGTPNLWSVGSAEHRTGDLRPLEVLGWAIYQRYWPPNNGNGCGQQSVTPLVISLPASVVTRPGSEPGIIRLPDSVFGNDYETLQLQGAGGAYTFQITGGGLPRGFSLSADGRLTGRPSSADINKLYTFTVYMTDGLFFGSQVYEIAVVRGSTDFSFVIDTTGSMWDDIGAVQANANQIIDCIRATGVDYRFSIVAYRDTWDVYIARMVQEFTADTAQIISSLNTLSADGGGDTPEAVYSGLMTSIGLNWRDGSIKNIILMGDAPSHDPDTNGYTLSSMLSAAAAASANAQPGQMHPRPIRIFPILVGGDFLALENFNAIAAGSGGQVLQAINAEQVINVICKAVNAIVNEEEVIPPVILPPIAEAPVVVEGQTAPPAPPNDPCRDTNGVSSSVVRATIPPDVVSSGGVYCHMVAQDGAFMSGPGEVGDPTILGMGVQQAVDVFALDAAGSPLFRFNRPVTICLRGTGALMFLEAQQSPRLARPMPGSPMAGFTCASLQSAGTLVLTAAAAPVQEPAAAQAPLISPVSGCTVTTTHMLNLRSEPSATSAVLSQVPYEGTYQVTERTAGWYRIIYLNMQGWVSASYVTTSGTCQ